MPSRRFFPLQAQDLTEEDVLDYTEDGEPVILIDADPVNADGHRLALDVVLPDGTIPDDAKSFRRWLRVEGMSLWEFLATERGWRLMEETPWLRDVMMDTSLDD